MQLFAPLPFMTRCLKRSSKRNCAIPRTRRRARNDSPRSADCAASVEGLEDRLLLAAQTVAPAFVLVSRSSFGNSPSASPAGVAPIDPAQMRAAYGVDQVLFNGVAGTGAGQTIAIVDAYNDPNIIADAAAFNSRFGLQAFNVSGGPTLRVLNQTGGASLPANSSPGGWDLEESLDVEWAHAIAPQANVILFEANSNSYSDLLQAVQTAASFTGVSAVSMSWGSGEFSSESSLDSIFTTPAGHQGVTFLASSGDSGTPAEYPAYSPNVVAVGGTSLTIDASGTYLGETPWDGGNGAAGGGVSLFESQPGYQVGQVNGTSSTKRTAADVAMDADPATGVYVLDSFDGGYFQVGGTSLSCPMWAGLIAIVNQGRALRGQSSLDGLSQTLPLIYGLPSSDFHDVVNGTNGTYAATIGYDLASGIGTPIANLLVPALAGYGTSSPPGNVPPGVSAPSSNSLTENGSFAWSIAGNDPITLTDASAGGNADELTLTVGHGTLTLAATSGLTFVAGSDHSASMTFDGTLADLNAALNGLVYTPSSGYSGPDTLHVSVVDPGDGLSGAANIGLTVNQPPSVNAPAAISVNRNTALVFSAAKGDAISVVDVTAGSSVEQLTLTATHGKLALATKTGLKIVSGANGSASMTIRGTVSNINATLNGLKFTPTSKYTGPASVSLAFTDLGTGLAASASVAVTVNPPPKFAIPPKTTFNENSPLLFLAPTAVSISDGGFDTNDEQLTLTAHHGTFSLATTAGLTFTAGANNAASMTIRGTLADINAALAGAYFTPTANYSGSASIALSCKNLTDGLSATANVTLAVKKVVGTAAAPAHSLALQPAASGGFQSGGPNRDGAIAFANGWFTSSPGETAGGFAVTDSDRFAGFSEAIERLIGA